jgi:hypothetical protein
MLYKLLANASIQPHPAAAATTTNLTSDSNWHSNGCRTPGATIAAACSHGRQQLLRLLCNAHLWRLALHTLL